MSDSQKTTVGVITYHSALNYGSVFQALATQTVFERYVGSTSIIDYRPDEQKRYYQLYRRHMGPKTFLADLTLLPEQRARRTREQRFADFIAQHLNLTSAQFSKPENAAQYAETFTVYVSGSDQILNKHSNELERSSWNYMDPYLLTFTDRVKVTYASSPASMDDEEYQYLVKPLQSFAKISAREQDAADKLSKLLDRPVETVLDPTLLLTAEDWDWFASAKSITSGTPYMLYYSLDGPRKGVPKLNAARKLATTNGMKLVAITPYTHVRTSGKQHNAADAGPAEFLTLIKNAACVVTDSYHGTLFSVNYHRPFWSISSSSGSSTRKDQALKRLGLESRITSSVSALLRKDDLTAIDWGTSEKSLEQLRQQSYDYIKSISLIK